MITMILVVGGAVMLTSLWILIQAFQRGTGRIDPYENLRNRLSSSKVEWKRHEDYHKQNKQSNK